MINVLFHYEAGPNLIGKLTSLTEQGLNVRCCDQSDDETFAALLPDTHVLWHVLRPVTAAHIRQAPGLKLIQKIGVGVNTIDLDAAKDAGVSVCNMPGTNAPAVAEMTLLLMLAALRVQPRLDALAAAETGRPMRKRRSRLKKSAARRSGWWASAIYPAPSPPS
ncbi:MAG: hypothetical protein R3C04_08940 [Hyphomonas sp.]